MDPRTSYKSAVPSATPLSQGNNGGFIPGMSMGQVPSQPGFVPQSNITVQVNGHYAFQHNTGTIIGPAPVNVTLSGSSIQAQPYSVINFGVPAPPQTHFPAQNTQYRGAEPTSTLSVPPPATVPSTGQRRGAGGRKAFEQEKTIRQFSQISKDADFKQLGERDERGNEKFKCLRPGCEKIIVPSSYVQHVLTASHRGDTDGACICPMCGKTLSRRDSVKRHQQTCEKFLARQAVMPVGSNTSQGSVGSSSVTVPAAPFTLPEPAKVERTSSATVNLGNAQTPLATDVEMQSLNTSMHADPSPPLPESSEFPDMAVAVAPDRAPFLASIDLQPEAPARVNTVMPQLTSNEGLDKSSNAPNTTSNVGNVQMPPSADEVTQRSDN